MPLGILDQFQHTFFNPKLGFGDGFIGAAVVDEKYFPSTHRDIMLHPFVNVHGFILHDAKHTQSVLVITLRSVTLPSARDPRVVPRLYFYFKIFKQNMTSIILQAKNL